MSLRNTPFDDAVEFERARGGQRVRRRDGGRRQPRLALGDQALLPVQALDLPHAEADAEEDDRDGEQRRPEARAKPALLHAAGGLCSRSWRYCRAMRPAFKGRIMAIAPTRISGVHNSRWTQIGGANLDLDPGREPDDDQPEKQDHEHLRAVACILGREVEPAAGQAGRTVIRPVKQPALAASRATTGERGPRHGYRRETRRIARSTDAPQTPQSQAPRLNRRTAPVWHCPCPTSRCRRTERARRHRRSANTRPPPPARNDGPA